MIRRRFYFLFFSGFFSVLIEDRKYTYEISETEHINVMLNTKDVSDNVSKSLSSLF